MNSAEFPSSKRGALIVLARAPLRPGKEVEAWGQRSKRLDMPGVYRPTQERESSRGLAMRRGLLYLAPAGASLLLAHCAAKDKTATPSTDASTDVVVADMNARDVGEPEAGAQDAAMQPEADALAQPDVYSADAASDATAMDAPADIAEELFACAADGGCPGDAMVCIYPVALGCSATGLNGVCGIVGIDCEQPVYCNCQGHDFRGGCVGRGFTVQPVSAGFCPCSYDGSPDGC